MRLLEALAGRPGLQALGVGFPGPLRGSNASGSFFIEGRPSTDRWDQPTANLGSVSGGFFEAMGIPLIAGRTFAETDGPKARRRGNRERRHGPEVLVRGERDRQADQVRERRQSALDHDRRDRRRRAAARAGEVSATDPLHSIPPVCAAVHERRSTKHHVSWRRRLDPSERADRRRSRAAVRRDHDASGRARSLGRSAKIPGDASRRLRGRRADPGGSGRLRADESIRSQAGPASSAFVWRSALNPARCSGASCAKD